MSESENNNIKTPYLLQLKNTFWNERFTTWHKNIQDTIGVKVNELDSLIGTVQTKKREIKGIKKKLTYELNNKWSNMYSWIQRKSRVTGTGKYMWGNKG